MTSFVQALEQIFFLFFFVGLAWAWVAIAGVCINAARTGNINTAFLKENQAAYGGLSATNPQQYNRRIVRPDMYWVGNASASANLALTSVRCYHSASCGSR